jgi:hypothetical protein
MQCPQGALTVGISSRLREERRVALLMLQRLLIEAESSLSVGERSSRAALDDVGKAFELFRSRQDTERESAAPARERECRRTSVVALARLLAEAEEAVASGDPEGVEVAIEIVRAALDVARRLDESSHSSEIRLRGPTKAAK